MLFACLTGEPPFKGDVQTVIKGHLSGEVPSVSRVVPSLPPAIDEVVRKGMAKSADQRYSSCVELVEAARKALESGANAAEGGSRQGPGQRGRVYRCDPSALRKEAIPRGPQVSRDHAGPRSVRTARAFRATGAPGHPTGGAAASVGTAAHGGDPRWAARGQPGHPGSGPVQSGPPPHRRRWPLRTARRRTVRPCRRPVGRPARLPHRAPPLSTVPAPPSSSTPWWVWAWWP